jgi:Co/Zn/Cd efflux system component
MLLQSIDLSRIIIIFIGQVILATIFLFIAIKLLRRTRQRPIITLSLLYILTTIGMIFNILHVLIASFYPGNEMLLIVIYFLTFFPPLFSAIFILTFIISILKLEDVFTIRKQLIITSIYGLLIILIFFIPGGITFTEQSRPSYSWTLLAAIYSVFTGFVVLPTIWYSIRLIKSFKDKILKKKLTTFLIGVFGMYTTVYGAILYITWQNPLFSTIWSVVTFFLMIPSAILIYYGIGREL